MVFPHWPLLQARTRRSAHGHPPNTCPGSHPPCLPFSLSPLVPRSHLCHQLCLHWLCRKCRCPETCLTALMLAGRPLLLRLSHHRRADDTIYIPHPSHSRSENLAASLGNMGLVVDTAHARDPEMKPRTISVPVSPAGPFTPPPPQPGHRSPRLCSPDLSPLSTPENP